MQILLFVKNEKGQVEKTFLDWNPRLIDQTMETIAQKGMVSLIRKSDFGKVEPYIPKDDFMNCGIRKDKIELYRALKLDTKKEHNFPRRIIVNAETPGAFKRSFSPFINKRFQFSDPSCMLLIQDVIHESLVHAPPDKLLNFNDKDPISSLLLEISQEETVQKLREVYLGDSPGVRLTRAMIFKASKSKSPVMILGESGTGKDLIARQIYKYSLNYKKGFQVVNCSALQETLLESELFGHIKGSFTGAFETRKGLFADTNGGTIFLDEIGDLSLANQAKILHAVDHQEIRAIGSNKTEKVDVRIIAATNRNLASMISQKTFREDLYYRLNTFTILTTSLREYPEDIPVIASSLWSKFNTPHALSPDFSNYLKEYHWPGNVRELKTMLNSIIDIFGQVAPSRSLVEAIRKYRRDGLQQSKNSDDGDFSRLIQVQSRNKVIEVQNILRAIKIELRPVINLQTTDKIQPSEIKKIQSTILQELNRVEDLCREPIFFKDLLLFDNIKRFRYILEKNITQWQGSLPQFGEIWRQELELLFDHINQEIFEMIWGKRDM